VAAPLSGASSGVTIFFTLTEENLCRASKECVLSSRYCKHSIFVEFVSGVAIFFSIENAKKSSPSVPVPLDRPTAVVELCFNFGNSFS